MNSIKKPLGEIGTPSKRLISHECNRSCSQGGWTETVTASSILGTHSAGVKELLRTQRWLRHRFRHRRVVAGYSRPGSFTTERASGFTQRRRSASAFWSGSKL